MDEVGGSGAPANVELVNDVENGEKETTEDSEAKIINETTTECITPAQIIPQIVPHMHMPPQHYIYPGHFMFGPPMMNMNGKFRLLIIMTLFSYGSLARRFSFFYRLGLIQKANIIKRWRIRIE